MNNRLIDLNATFDGNKVFISFVYGDMVVRYRDLVWERLTWTWIQILELWLMVGNFNKLTDNYEKNMV